MRKFDWLIFILVGLSFVVFYICLIYLCLDGFIGLWG